ncbi:MAG: type II secretion system protein M [Gammaproteobacteria bacterium]|nr:type II secretion system protein M [Gammaproteobacteria bacterium]
MSPARHTIAWVNSRPLRERLLIGATILVLMVVAGDWVILQPARDSGRSYARAIEQLREEQATRQARFAEQLAALQRKETQTGETAVRRMREEIARLKASIGRDSLATISPTQMVSVLREMFARDAAVTLTVVENAEPQPIVQIASMVGDTEKLTPMLFKHPLTVEFTGDYPKIVEFLKRIEALDWQLIWEDFSIVMEDYPTARARVVLHTLSLERGWVGA